MFFKLILEKGRKEEKNIYLFVVSLICAFIGILVCALSLDQIHNLGILGLGSNQLSSPISASERFYEVVFIVKVELWTKLCNIQISFVKDPIPVSQNMTVFAD